MKISDIATSMQLTDDEYLPIWTALMETGRGRRFLSEFARRTRASETRTLLDAVHKLESALLGARRQEELQQQALQQSHEQLSPVSSEAEHTLRAAIAQATPDLEYASRINSRAIADLQDTADDMHAAISAIRDTIRALPSHGAATALRACDDIDARIVDIGEIIAVQQINDDRARGVCAGLAALVTASPHHAGQEMVQERDEDLDQDAGFDARESFGATRNQASQPQHAAAAAARQAQSGRMPPVANVAPAQSPAVQQLIQEITTRLLNAQDNGPAIRRDRA